MHAAKRALVLYREVKFMCFQYTIYCVYSPTSYTHTLPSTHSTHTHTRARQISLHVYGARSANAHALTARAHYSGVIFGSF